MKGWLSRQKVPWRRYYSAKISLSDEKILWRMKCSNSDWGVQEEMSPPVWKGGQEGEHRGVAMTGNVKMSLSDGFTVWSSPWWVPGCERSQAYQAESTRAGPLAWLPEQLSVTHLEDSWASRQKGAGAVTGFAGPQRSTALTQLWRRPEPGQAGLSQRVKSAQVPVLASLQISSKVTKVVSGTFPGKQTCLPPSPRPRSPHISLPLLDLVLHFFSLGSFPTVRRSLALVWNWPAFKSSLSSCLLCGLKKIIKLA